MATSPQDLLAEASCYLCHGISMDEGMELALLARVANTPPAVPPVLSFNFPNLSWTFSGTDPQTWSIQESPNGITDWTEVDSVPGSSRSDIFTDSGVAARIVGVGPAISPSNVVIIP